MSLLPFIKGLGLRIENGDWIYNRTKNNTIQLHLFNQSFNYIFDVKKSQWFAFIFLLGEFSTI